MATSGSTNFNRTRNELLTGALRLIGKAGRGKTASDADIADAAEALEMMIKTWQGKGIHLWKLAEATLFVTKGTASYSFPGAHCTLSYVETDIATAAANGAVAISVDSIAGMSDGDNIGIALDSGALQWTTISGAPSGTTVALAAALTDAVAVGNTVFVYTTKIVRPLRVIDARRQGTQDVQIDVFTREEYFAQPNKTASGEVNQVYYDPQLTTGKFYIWPTGNAVDDKVQITLMLPIEDFDSSNINPDFPQEWLEVIKFNLAWRLNFEYGISNIDHHRELKAEAKRMLKEISDFDAEGGSVYFAVENY